MTTTPHSGTDGLTEDQRRTALDRFQILRPHLEEDIPLARIAHEQMLSFRTLSRWAASYHRLGLAGLCRKSRTDRDQRRMSPTLQQFTEGLALEKPQLSAAAVHREAALIAARLGEPVPSYRTVHRVIRGLEPALVTLAHDGAKAYSETFDLVHRTEAKGPNAIWQADHTELDIFVTDGSGKPRKPWLTVILDDYSRAVAGYLLFFSAPSAIQTALALRQAIWRKAQPGWHICGIPQVLYTDHGSDFTSQHLEQVAADLKIRLSFSTVGKPRGRGKIERFFESLSQVCLSRLPGYGRPASAEAAVLTLPQLTRELEHYLIDDYLVTPHSATRQAPQALGSGRVPPADAGIARATRPAPAHRAQDPARQPGRHPFPGDALRRHHAGGLCRRGRRAPLRPPRRRRGPGVPPGPFPVPGSVPGAGGSDRNLPGDRHRPQPPAAGAAPDPGRAPPSGRFPAGGQTRGPRRTSPPAAGTRAAPGQAQAILQ